MLRNYFIIVIAVLKRRKFFTFISLFGISFTITVLIVLSSFVDYLISPGYPETKRERSLYIYNIQEKNSRTGELIKGGASYYFLDRFASKLKTPEKIAISSLFSPVNIYINNKKATLFVKYSNAELFDVIEYKFLEGKSFSKEQVVNGDKVVVITKETKEFFFGDRNSVVGEYIEISKDHYRVNGVIENIPATMFYSYSDIILPYTMNNSNYMNRSYFGSYFAILLAHSQNEIEQIKNEYNKQAAKIPIENNKYDEIFSHADTYFESIIRPMFGEKNDFKKSGFSTTILISIILMLMFMLLPAINLMNINISRIMERSSEIGIRKAFGASSSSLIYQFLIENIILTLIGGLIALVTSFFIILIINNSGIIPNIHLSINFVVLMFCLLTSLIFGLISGVFPAWRMSRVQIIEALKTK